jgi:protein-L-isoaspartate(D-aspartate) O-methyltransferase
MSAGPGAGWEDRAVPDELIALQQNMVARVRALGGARDDRVAQALLAVPRHHFLPELPAAAAYRDEAIVTKRDADGQPISSSSQPTMMAIMLDQLGLRPGQRVLEIGAGTGYNAALMDHLVGADGVVVSVDIDQDLVDAARANLVRAGHPEVRVVCADGADGLAAAAPYDRIIATVGVWDLAPAWLAQLTPAGRIVVPLDLGGADRSAAFERADDQWISGSVLPCGFMSMRGTLAGPQRTRVVDADLSITVGDGRDLPAAVVSTALTGDPATHRTDVVASPRDVFDGVSLWLAAHEPRRCTLSEAATAAMPRLARAPLAIQDRRVTTGILDGDSLAVLLRPAADGPLAAWGYGPRGDELAGDLAHQVSGWQAAGRPGTAGMRIAAHPRPARGSAPRDGLVIDRPHTRFVLSWPADAPTAG